ncbi:MAG TPA: folate-binding protein [Terriglobales bacterium]|jgi:aminomethyltransferase
MISTIHDQLLASGAALAPYCGVETSSEFPAGATAEFRALTTSCGIYDLSWRAKIAVTGEDRVRWLNGMVTNNVRDLQVGEGNYNFLLNAKGQILGDLYAYNRGDSMWIDTERSQAEGLMATLDRFIIMDDAELTDISDKVSAVAVQGPKAKHVLAAIGLSVSDLKPLHIFDTHWREHGVSITQMESSQFRTFEIWAAAHTIPLLWEALTAAGAAPVGTRALEWFRVMAGVPKYGQDIRIGDLPQETGQMQALNFTKGCYIGQEIVERIRSRGAVHRLFTGFIAEQAEPAPGMKLHSDGKEVGVITSVARVPSLQLGERILCLGYIRREALSRGTPITFEGGTITAHDLPFATE